MSRKVKKKKGCVWEREGEREREREGGGERERERERGRVVGFFSIVLFFCILYISCRENDMDVKTEIYS